MAATSRLAVVFTVVTFFAASASSARADTILLRAGSSVYYAPVGEDALITFIANGFAFSDHLDTQGNDKIQVSGLTGPPIPAPGLSVDLSSHALLTRGGAQAFVADLTFEAGETTLVGPEQEGGEEFQGSSVVPFTMLGTLMLFDETGALLTTHKLSGRGLASLFETPYQVFVYYSFTSPEPVPEPATLMLFGSGLAGCLLRRCKLRRV